MTEFEIEFKRILRGTLNKENGLITAFQLEEKWKTELFPKPKTYKKVTQTFISPMRVEDTFIEFKKAIANYCIENNMPIRFLQYDNRFEFNIQSKVIGFYNWDAKTRIEKFNEAKNELQVLL